MAFGGLEVAWLGICAYLRPFWDGAWGAIGVASVLMAVLFCMELCFPGKRWHARTLAFNVLYIPVSLTLGSALVHPLDALVTHLLPKNLLAIQLPADISPISVLYFLFYLALFDFFFYWFHRAQHAWPFLWRFHTLHHADTNVSMVSSGRHHWSEDFVRFFFIAIPMVILFGGPEGIPFWMLAGTGLFGLVIHWNMPWRLAFLAPWVVTPWYHRLHHSVEVRHFDKNFAVFFPFWDRLFGTQHLPAAGEFVETGMAELTKPNGLGLLLPWPMPSFKPALQTPAFSPGDRAQVLHPQDL